jgi:CheY-like chemotaxis protein
MLILVAEDNPDNQEILARRLKRKGFDVIVASDGQKAVEMTLSERPDMVLMDISMPVMSGLEATIALRKHENLADLPIIALTAHAMDRDREKCFAAGCTNFATKPVDFKNLLNLIAENCPQEEQASNTA